MKQGMFYSLFCLLSMMMVRADAPSADGSDLPNLILAVRDIVTKDQKLAQNKEAPNGPVPKTSNQNQQESSSVVDIPVAKAPTDARTMKRQNAFAHILATLRINAARNDYTDAILSAEALQAGDKTPAAQSALSSLILRLYQLRDAQEAAATRNVKSVLDHATQLVLNSSDPKRSIRCSPK